MGYLNYAIVSLISFLGLYAGMLLAFISPEELKPGRRYFKFMKGMIFIIMAVVCVYLTWHNNALFFLTALVFMVFYIKFIESPWLFFALALYIGIGYHTRQFFILLACLAFICGLPAGSLFVMGWKKKKKHKLEILVDAFFRHAPPYLMAAVLSPLLLSYL